MVEGSGETPGKRYGHVMTYSKPNLIVFGGYSDNKETNDLWIINVQVLSQGWIFVKPKGTPPAPRVYHSISYSSSGATKGMILVYGGRSDKTAQNDLWGLTRHRDSTWSWREAPNKSSATLVGRYQHTSHCIGNHFVVVGGRTNLNDVNLPLDVFDMEINEWSSLSVSTQRFRHASWSLDQLLFVHAGFPK